MKYLNLITLILILTASMLFAQNETKLSLKECIQITIENNSELKNAERNVKIAKSGILMAYSNILPTLNTDLRIAKTYQGEVEYLQDVPVEYEREMMEIPILDPISYDTVNIVLFPVTGKPTRYEQKLISQDAYSRRSNSFSINLNQNIFDGGRWWNSIRKARADKRGSEYFAETTRQQIILNTKLYYFNLLKQQALLKVFEEALHSTEEQYNRTKSMYEIGSVAQADVYKARVSVGEAKSNLIKQENLVNVSKYNLNYVMGRDPRTPIEVVDENIEFIPQENMELPIESALENNPELQTLRTDITSAEFSHKIAKGNFWPVLRAGASYSRFSPEFDRVYKGYDKNYNWYAGVSLSYNIFNGFADKANKDIEKLRYLNAQETFLERKRQIRADVEEYRSNMKANLEIIEINKENLVSAEEDLRLARERYRVGSGTLLEVLEAQVSVIRAQSNLISAKYDALISQAQLEAALGIVRKE